MQEEIKNECNRMHVVQYEMGPCIARLQRNAHTIRVGTIPKFASGVVIMVFSVGRYQLWGQLFQILKLGDTLVSGAMLVPPCKVIV